METGKYNQINRVDRHCPFCGCNQIKDVKALADEKKKKNRKKINATKLH